MRSLIAIITGHIRLVYKNHYLKLIVPMKAIGHS